MRSSAFVCIFVAVAACGGDDSISLSSFESKLLDAICSNAVTCKGMPDAATCKAATQLENKSFATLIAKAKSGAIKYHSDKAKACLDSIANQSCAFDGFYTNTTNPCDDVFTGTVAAAGACITSYECADQGRCKQTDSNCDASTTCCAGTCMATPAKVPVGGDCTSAPCVDTAYCSSTTNKCTTPIATAGATCDDIDSCANPMYCDIFATAPTCVAPAMRNATCDPNALLPCADGRDYCDATSKVCTPVAAVGAACGGTGMIQCVGFASCDTSMMCTALPAAGASCLYDSQNMRSNCLGDLDCSANATPCTLPPAGTACPRIAPTPEQTSKPIAVTREDFDRTRRAVRELQLKRALSADWLRR